MCLTKSTAMTDHKDADCSSDEDENGCGCTDARVTVGDHVTTDIDGVSVEGRVVSIDDATKSCTIEPIVSTSGPGNAAQPSAVPPAVPDESSKSAENTANAKPAEDAKPAKDAKSAEDAKAAKDAKPAKDAASDGNNACWWTTVAWVVMEGSPSAEQDAAEGKEKKEGQGKKEGGKTNGNYNSPHMQVARAIMCG